MRSCHSFGDGRERRAKGVAAATADMGTLVRGVLVGKREKKDEVGNAWWEVVKRGREF